MMLGSVSSLILAVLMTVGSAKAEVEDVVIQLDDVSTADRYPFGDYSNFLSVDEKPALISFDFVTNDAKCEIRDNRGNIFSVVKGRNYRFSEIYFPINVFDVDDNNKCDGSAYKNISIRASNLASYRDDLEITINQNAGFYRNYFSKLPGVNVNMSVRAKFYNNFEDMECIELGIVDKAGKRLILSDVNEEIIAEAMVLPLRIYQIKSCLTSPLNLEDRESQKKDIDFKIVLGVAGQ